MDSRKDILFRISESPDMMPVLRASKSDLNEARLEEYLLCIREKYGAIFLEDENLLEKLGILFLVENIWRPTLAGLLLFGKHPQIHLPQIHVTLVTGNGKDAEIEKIGGTLNEMKERTMERIGERIGKRIVVGYLSKKPVEAPAYPLEAIEEAVVNALIHRDYDRYALGKYIRISMDSKSIEIKSPGTIIGENLDDLALEDYHHAKNGTMVRIMEEMGQVRNAGMGIGRMFSATREFRLEPPAFQMDSRDFTVRFGTRQILSAEDMRKLSEMNLKLDEDQMAAVSFVQKHGSISNGDYQHLNDVNRDEAFRELKRLVDQGILAAEGTGSGTYYVLGENFEENAEQKSQLSFFGGEPEN